MFRFATGDSSDPIDTHSFAVAVDGKDRTALFQEAGDVAFGPLALRRTNVKSRSPSGHTA
ncbi:MAG TPA: hypothetical protein VGJ18_18740 [Gemmatimonadaceae bacterium]